MKVALWLPMSLDAKLAGEGIWRVVKQLLLELARQPDRGVSVTVVGPEWIASELTEELGGILVAANSPIKVFTPRVSRFAVRAMWYLHRRNRKRTAKRQISRLRRFERAKRRFELSARLVTNPLTAILATPLVAALGIAQRIRSAIEEGATPIDPILRRFTRRSFGALLEAEYLAIRSAYVRENQNPDVWWIPSPLARGAFALEGPRVMHLFDFVFADYPKGQPLGSIVESKLEVRRNLSRAARILVGSDHVKYQVGVALLGIPKERIDVIPHAAPDLSRPLAQALGTNTRPADWFGERDRLADLIRGHVENRRLNWPLVDEFSEEMIVPRLAAFRFEDEPYVMIATQHRPYKNVLAVLKAVRRLNQRRQRRIFLVTTGEVRFGDPKDEIARYVIDNNMVTNLLPIPRVPDHVLAALYACAHLAIHPSLYEGGIGAFPFFEAMSVDCPALMADSLAMREALGSEPGYEPFIFNPHDTRDLARRIEFALDHRAELVNDQREVFERVTRRRWSDALDEYIQVFDEVAGSVTAGALRS